MERIFQIKKIIPLSLRLKPRLLMLNWKLKQLKPVKVKSKNKVDKTIVVMGMHRSGTSLTSKVLSNFGVTMGEEALTTPAIDNPAGFFEDEHFVGMNEKILLLAGGCWDSPPPHKKILKLRENNKLIEELKMLVSSHQDVLWGWKDPRAALTIDLYLPFLKNPYFIVCHRNPLSIAKSLNKRHKFPLEETPEKLIEIYNDRLSNFLDKVYLPRLHIGYEDYFTSPKVQINKIKDFLEFKDDIDINLMINSVDGKLKHH